MASQPSSRSDPFRLPPKRRGGERWAPDTEALAWWHSRAERHAYAGLGAELPDSAAAVRVLEDRRLIALTPGRWGFVVCTRTTDPEEALRTNYWPLVAALVGRYQPAAIDRLAALRLYTGDESIRPVVDVVHAASRSAWLREVLPGAAIVLRPVKPASPEHPSLPWLARLLTVAGTPVPVVPPERLLLALTVGDVRDGIDTIVPWLRSLVVSHDGLLEAYRATPRPTLLKRMADLARDAGNPRLADAMEMVLRARSRVIPSRSKTGVGGRLLVPRHSATAPRAPWLGRVAATFARAAEQLGAICVEQEGELSTVGRPLALAYARAAKAEDVYHGTAIEGYDVTRADVDAVLGGQQAPTCAVETGRSRAALTGYSEAFDGVLETLQAGDPPLVNSTPLILQTARDLWGPSVAARLVEENTAGVWRRERVQIAHSWYAPPPPEHVGQLMELVVDWANRLTGGALARAVFLHWALVHVHPFQDGNGRVARLMMNAVLCDAGLPWTTVRVGDRLVYTASLEAAHLATNLAPLARFLGEEVTRAAAVRTGWLEAHNDAVAGAVATRDVRRS